MKLINVQFMTTTGCHLCEQAYGMINYLMENDEKAVNNIHFQVVEISNDDELVEKYGVRIPVLAHDSREIGWPFSLEELRLWLIQLQ